MPVLPRDRTYPCLLRIVMREKRNYVSWCRLIPAHVVVRLQHRGRCITQSANGARPWDDRRRFRRRPPFVYGRSSGRAPRRPAADGESADDGFTDSIFDGRCELAGLTAVRVDTAQEIMPAAMSRASIPVVVSLELADLLRLLGPDAMVDARMRKREYPEHQRGLAPLTIGLGPNFIAADNVDVVIETSWDDLGRIIDTGAARPLAGEPRGTRGPWPRAIRLCIGQRCAPQCRPNRRASDGRRRRRDDRTHAGGSADHGEHPSNLERWCAGHGGY